MSSAPLVRRADRLMADAAMRELLARAHTGRVATVGADWWPYVIPLLYVWRKGEIWIHNTRARGHLRSNIEHHDKVCFEIDEPGDVFPYGRYECDTALAYRSVVVFGRIRIVDDLGEKTAFFEELMAKYADPRWHRAKNFFPRLDQVTVYAIAVEYLTGKETPLPAPENRWPVVDHTKSPDATPS